MTALTFEPVDVADAVQAAINAEEGYTAAAIPLPSDYQSHLPFALVTPTGGWPDNPVVDNQSLSIDVYGETWAAATAAANHIIGLLRNKAFTTVSGCRFYRVVCDPPYANPDPDNPEKPQVTFRTEIYVRSN